MSTNVSVGIVIDDTDTGATHVTVSLCESVHMGDPEDIPALVLEAGALTERMVTEALAKIKPKIAALHGQMEQKHGS
jgi:hypothetical protein